MSAASRGMEALPRTFSSRLAQCQTFKMRPPRRYGRCRCPDRCRASAPDDPMSAARRPNDDVDRAGGRGVRRRRLRRVGVEASMTLVRAVAGGELVARVATLLD